MERRDLAVIGGGPAGYVAAIRGRQLGATVALVESDALGGTCLNRGCIPTRALVRGVELLDLPRKAKEYGVSLGDPEVDFSRMVTRKDTIVKTVGGGLKLLLEANGVEVLCGRARLLSPSEVEVSLPDGSVSRVAASGVIVATGARDRGLAVPGGDGTLSTEQALALEEVPESMVIAGGGAMALAFATIFARLGSRVSLVTEEARLLPEVDAEAVSLLERELKKQKVQVYVESTIAEVRGGRGSDREVVLSGAGEGTVLTARQVLAAQGRQANVEGIGLEAVGVALDDGCVRVNGRMQTSVPGVFAAGDVCGEPMLAHAAFAEGRAAAENALGRGTELDRAAVPRCIHTFPEIASVGLTEEEARSQGYQVRVGRFPLAANGMATILGERSGFVKVVSETGYGQILGVHIVGPHAGDMIAEAALAMRLESTPQDMGATVHVHPTLSEALMEAALDASDGAIHFFSQQ